MLIIHFMFLASGAASLIYQVIWFKQLQFVLGSSTFAVSVTVASFFFGLSLGSWLGGRLADRLRRPLRAYGFVELGVGVVSLAITIALSKWSLWVPWLAPFLGNHSPLSATLAVLVSFSALAVPTLLMGATLPLLARYVIREQQALARRIGLLYGINTLGAAIGCAAVGLFLIGAFGLLYSAVIGSAIYVSIAALAGVLVLRGPADDGTVPEPSALMIEATASEHSSGALVGLVFVFALSGFISIAYEVLWFRILSNFSLHTVFAFSAMLTTYLIGLVLGALICAKFLAHRKDRLLVHFAQLQILIATAGMVTVALLGRSRNILALIAPLPGHMGIPGHVLAPLASTVEIMLLCLVVFLVPTTLIGVGFPLASELTIRRLSVLGSRLGKLYALNTIAGMLGSLSAAFLMLPYLGTQASFMLLIALNLLLFAVMIASQPSLRRDRRLWRLGIEGALACGIGMWFMGSRYLSDAQTRFEGGQVLAFQETRDATFVVMGYHSEEAGDYQQLLVNGKSYASNAPPGRRYMAMLGHLPALMHPSPQSALVACVGTGTTVGALTLHPSVHAIKAVDLAQAVFDFAPFFEPLNHRFHTQGQVQSIVADARHYLLTSEIAFDLITFEPPPPQDAGVVNLYSREFYQIARRRLAPGGSVTQWVPLDISRQALPRMMIRTMMAEFPHVSLWIPNRMEGIAMGSMEPIHIDLGNWRQRMGTDALQTDLAAIGFASPEEIAATFVAADGALAALIGDGPIVTDDQPRIEYFNLYPIDPMRYEQIIDRRESVERYLAAPGDPAALEAAREVITLIWKQHEASTRNSHDEAHDLLQRALTRDPDNAYLRYLLTQEQDLSRP